MNSQQDPYMSGGGFPMAAPNNNRSPGARLNSFTTHSFSNLRPGQRQMENAAQLSTPQYSTGNDPDRFNTVDSGFRHAARTQHSPGYAGDGYLNNSLASWSYNGGANTVNGAMGESRLRSGARRAVIPAEWLTSDPSGSLGSQPLPPPSNQYSSVMNYNQLGMMNGSDGGFGAGDRQGYQNMYDPRHEPKSLGSDLIPTAIVIKNIPFNVRKEMLTTIMSELGLPQPYAFNYHFDNGIFRGLAFANFQSPIDTQTVIEQLNGYEVQGRKLRVEYKKMLPEHERERIEREKREKRGQLEEQHQPLTLHSQSSMHSLNASHSTRSRTSPLRKSTTKSTIKLTAASTNPATLAGDVDLNNPDTLSFYTELTLFKNDGNREIIVFPSTITPQQRRTVHILAHNMGLEHRSVGEGADRQIHVLKDSALFAAQAAQTLHLPPGVSADAHRRGLSRAATIDFAETRTSAPGQFATLSRSGRHGPTLELPDSPDGGLNALRGVKSFADLRSYTPSPSLSSSGFPGSAHAPNVAQYGEYGGGNVTGHTSSMTTPTTPGTSSNNDPSMLIQDLGSMSLGDSFGSNRLRPREAPTPGAIGSQRPGLNGNSTRSVPERQPLGPNSDWNEGIGFGNRTRTNGHMQRGSDSSDAAVRGATSSSSSRFQ